MSKLVRQSLWSSLLLLGIAALGVVAAAQVATLSTIHVKAHKVAQTSSIRGVVQVFSHTAITIRHLDNPMALETFDLSPELQDKYRERHLDYDDAVRITYSIEGRQALAVRAHWRKGS